MKLAVTPVGRELLSQSRLVPGDSISGLVQLSNLTGAPLNATPRLHTLRGEAPDALRVELLAGGRSLYRGSIAGFHPTVRLGARASRELRFRFSAPRAQAREVEGRSFDLSVRWATERAGR